jgi:hypothetical protein
MKASERLKQIREEYLAEEFNLTRVIPLFREWCVETGNYPARESVDRFLDFMDEGL